MSKKFGSLSSSENPEKLADTVKGLILGFGVVIIFIAQQLGIELGSEQITEFAIGAGAAVSALLTVYGLVKKFILFMQAKLAENKG